MPTIGALSELPPIDPWNAGTAEGEDPAVGADQPVPPGRGSAAMPTMGALSELPPIDPWKTASPKAKIPPSAATSQ